MRDPNIIVGDDFNANPERQPRPYVQFELRPLESRDENGLPVYKDIPWALVTPAGSKDRLERPASEWLESLDQHAQAGRVPPEWPRQYREALRLWVEGQELPVHGTPIKNWPPLTKSQRKALESANVQTVEDLALANDELKARIGMGAENLVRMAKAWVEEQKGPGKLAAQLEIALEDVRRMKEQNEELLQKVRALEILVPQDKKVEAPSKPGGAIVIGG